MNKFSSVPSQSGKTAIILYGLFRTANLTYNSFNKHLADYLDADVFYCGYKFSDKPILTHEGLYDKFGFMKENPKNTCDIDSSNEITEVKLKYLYTDRLKASFLHEMSLDKLQDKLSFVDPNELLFKLVPTRFLSVFYNIQEAYRLIEDYEKENGFVYENIIIARPDLAFYSHLDIGSIRAGTIKIPAGTGFCPHTGTLNVGLVQPLYYKNVHDGTCIPTGMHFNDQLMALNRNDCGCLKTMLDDCIGYMKKRVPLTPETIMFYHFCVINQLKVIQTKKWVYEIFRIGTPEIDNITNIPLLERYDPHHPIVNDRARNNRIKYFLKSLRKNYHFYRNKVRTLIQG
ncbi:hypothetical protein [Leminorella grimontii]|uniref:hypothetical protein n=1 Tax=Leminorella grimontii TaxID=82981 RepID=UPI0020849497|nr:hypothetical protein [Leminorella grimontii]GKX58423.1 hypothetical protein SOASR031_07380 [Leminorella grimontii]